MKYEKKLIILNEVNSGFGRAQVRGTCSIERSIAGLKCYLCIFNLKDTERGEYLFGLSLGEARTVVTHLGRHGKIAHSFDLDTALSLEGKIVGVLAYADGKTALPVAYGGNEGKNVWQGNMLDGIIRNIEFFDSTSLKDGDKEKNKPAQKAGKPTETDLEIKTEAESKNNLPSNSAVSFTRPAPPAAPIRGKAADYTDNTYKENQNQFENKTSSEAIFAAPPKTAQDVLFKKETADRELEVDSSRGNQRDPFAALKNPFNEAELSAALNAEKRSSASLFLDILPKEDYCDNVVAVENYYPPDYAAAFTVDNTDAINNDLVANSRSSLPPQPQSDPKSQPYPYSHSYSQFSAEKSADTAITAAQNKNRPFEYDSFKKQDLRRSAANGSSNGVLSKSLTGNFAEEDSRKSDNYDFKSALKNESKSETKSESEYSRARSESTTSQVLSSIQPSAGADNTYKSFDKEPFGGERESRREQNGAFSKINAFGAAETSAPPSRGLETAPKRESGRELKEVRPFFAESKKEKLRFYDKIKDQIENLFKKFPKAEEINQLLPDTNWVKVDYDNNGKYYVIGLIGDEPAYIAYGVPAEYSPEPPKELEGYCQWFPLDYRSPRSNGFWLMYQDANTGENVEVEII